MLTENTVLRKLLSIHNESVDKYHEQLTIAEDEIFEKLNLKSTHSKQSPNKAASNNEIKSLLDQAKEDTQKRIDTTNKLNLANNLTGTSSSSSELGDKRPPLDPNMKPKSAYLFDSPDASDEDSEEEEDEETVIKGVTNKYLF